MHTKEIDREEQPDCGSATEIESPLSITSEADERDKPMSSKIGESLGLSGNILVVPQASKPAVVTEPANTRQQPQQTTKR
jgi:hypothetical protein